LDDEAVITTPVFRRDGLINEVVNELDEMINPAQVESIRRSYLIKEKMKQNAENE